jgi:hypothetical protein
MPVAGDDTSVCNLFGTCGVYSAASRVFPTTAEILSGRPCRSNPNDPSSHALPVMFSDTGDFVCPGAFEPRAFSFRGNLATANPNLHGGAGASPAGGISAGGGISWLWLVAGAVIILLVVR